MLRSKQGSRKQGKHKEHQHLCVFVVASREHRWGVRESLSRYGLDEDIRKDKSPCVVESCRLPFKGSAEGAGLVQPEEEKAERGP